MSGFQNYNSNTFGINPNPNGIVYNQEFLNSFANLKVPDNSNNLIYGTNNQNVVMAQRGSEIGNIWAVDYNPFSKGNLLPSSENESTCARFPSDCVGASEQWGRNSLLEQQYGLNMYSDPRIQTMERENVERHQTMVTENRGQFVGYNYGSMSHESNHKEMKELLSLCSGFMHLLVVDEKYQSLFQKLVDGCEGLHLGILVAEVFSDSSFLIDAAFTRQGTISIKQLIRKLKDSHHAFTLTKLLSTRLYEMVTHHIAKCVINECLHVFGSEPNEVLYEQVIQCYANLAVHILGCRFLNECIDTISGYNKEKLLLRIADSSDYLSNNPFGNYVVQYVLALRNSVVNEIIFSRLKGQFVSLAMKKGGSHIVERCLECCDDRTHIVINEILQVPMGPYLLARHQFGNYVIQKALDLSKRQGRIILYESLARALRPYISELNESAGGRNVVNILRCES